MGGGPRIPPAPPQPDPGETARANADAYRMNVDTYIEKNPAMAALENKLRIQYMPKQRALERELSELDQRAGVQAGLQLERQYGPQRTLEGLRRQYEQSPEAYALNRGLGDQMTKQFERLYGASPYGSVEQNVAFNQQQDPYDPYFTNLQPSKTPKV